MAFAAGVLLISSLSEQASASYWKRYRVQRNDTLDSIATFYNLSIRSLKDANKMERNRDLQAGRRIKIPAVLSRGIPNRLHEIKSGETLAKIAARYDVSTHAIKIANRIKRGRRLASMGRLIIPLEDGERNPVFWPQLPFQNDKLTKFNEMLKPFFKKPSRKIYTSVFHQLPAHFVRVRNNRQVTLPLVNENGKVNQYARRVLSILSGPDGTNVPKVLFNNELMRLLHQVAQDFPGKTIEVISGYRSPDPPKKKRRRRGWRRKWLQKIQRLPHANGRAIDFNVHGVRKRKLFRYLKKYEHVGIGYYTNSPFIHLDVREIKTIWVDKSGVGEDSQYTKVQMFPTKEQRVAIALAKAKAKAESKAKAKAKNKTKSARRVFL